MHYTRKDKIQEYDAIIQLEYKHGHLQHSGNGQNFQKSHERNAIFKLWFPTIKQRSQKEKYEIESRYNPWPTLFNAMKKLVKKTK